MTAEPEHFPAFSPAEFDRREAAIRTLMARRGLDALVLYGNGASDCEVQYLANHEISFEAVLVFPLEGDPALLVHFVNHQQTAARVGRIADVRWAGDDAGAGAAACLAEKDLVRARIGVAGPMPYYRLDSLRSALPEVELVDFRADLARQRLVKSEEEIEWIRIGARHCDAAIRALHAQVRAGLTEHELAAIVEDAYIAKGGSTHIHFIGVTSMRAPQLCAPAQAHSDRRVRAGDVILTEISAAHHGYWGQVLRTFSVGEELSPAYRRMHDTATAVFTAIEGRLCAGATSDEILDAAELVHEDGLTIFDDLVHCAVGGSYAPYLRTRRTQREPVPAFTYEEDMIVVVQPNVVTPDLLSGVQFGEMLRVRADGIERFHEVPRGALVCG